MGVDRPGTLVRFVGRAALSVLHPLVHSVLLLHPHADDSATEGRGGEAGFHTEGETGGALGYPPPPLRIIQNYDMILVPIYN